MAPFYSDLLDDFMGSGFLTADERRGVPALNVKKDKNELTLELRVLGLKKENIKLTPYWREKGGKGQVFKEREFSSFSFHRSIELPEERYNVAKTEVSYKNGLLEIKMPKFEQKDKLSKTIEVK